MVSALLQLSPGLCEAGEGSSPAGVTAQRRSRGLARSAVRRKFVLDVGLSAVALSIDALVFVGHIALIFVAGGLDLFILLQVRPTAADEAAARPTHHCLVLCFFALLYVCVVVLL